METNYDVLVYSRKGTDKVCVKHASQTLAELLDDFYTVGLVDCNTLGGVERWEKSAKLLVIPGGVASSYTDDLSEDIDERIKVWVECGGNLSGFALVHIMEVVGAVSNARKGL